jgi:hypothetical protein
LEAEAAWGGPAPQVVFDHSGNAVAIWSGQAGIQVTFKPAGRAWRSPATIGSGSSNGDVKLALDAKGDATALWMHTISVGGGVPLQSAFKPANGSWQRAVTVSHQGWPDWGPPDLAVARGNATAAWSEWVKVNPNACTTLVRAAIGPAGRGWGHPVTLQRYQGKVKHNPDAYCSGPGVDVRVAFAGPGRATAVWSDFTGTNSVLRSASKPLGGPWGRAVTIAARTQWIASLRLAGSPRGSALAVWRLSDAGTPDVVQAAMASSQGAWRSPITLGIGTQLDAALDAHANAVVVWVHDLRDTNLLPVQLVIQATAFTR